MNWAKCILQINAWKRATQMEKEHLLTPRKIDLGGHSLFLEDSSGNFLPIMLLHGLLDSWLGFRRLVPHLNSKYKLLLPDLPGFGRSSLPGIKYLYKIPIMADMIYQAIQDLDLRNLVLGGHSMGALIAQHIALRDTDRRITQLILISPGGMPHPKRDEMRELLFPRNREEMFRLLNSLYYEKTPELSGFTQRILLNEWNSEKYKYLAENTILEEESVFLGKGFHSIKIPTLLISGAEDPITDNKMVKKLGSYYKNSRIIILPKAKHAIHLERPEEVAKEILSFLD